MITDIHGSPYTSVEEDLDLIKIKDAMRAQILADLREDMVEAGTSHSGMCVDVRPWTEYLILAYILGRAREGCTKAPTRAEDERVTGMVADFICAITEAIDSALADIAENKTDLDVGMALLCVDQAYYAGREDGSA